MTEVQVGSVWIEDYDFGNDFVRRVAVLAIDGSRAKIRTLAEDSPLRPLFKFRSGSRETWCKLSRFGKAGGYKPATPNSRSEENDRG